MKNFTNFSKIKYDENGLLPAIVQDSDTKQVLMVAWMDQIALHQTIKTGQAFFWSRSRKKLWCKGDTSGNYLNVKEILIDCDADTLLLKVEPAGPACHTGETSCFFRNLELNNA